MKHMSLRALIEHAATGGRGLRLLSPDERRGEVIGRVVKLAIWAGHDVQSGPGGSRVMIGDGFVDVLAGHYPIFAYTAGCDSSQVRLMPMPQNDGHEYLRLKFGLDTSEAPDGTGCFVTSKVCAADVAAEIAKQFRAEVVEAFGLPAHIVLKRKHTGGVND